MHGRMYAHPHALSQVHTMYSKLDNKQKATILEISDVANILAEAPWKLAEGFQYFLQVSFVSLL